MSFIRTVDHSFFSLLQSASNFSHTVSISVSIDVVHVLLAVVLLVTTPSEATSMSRPNSPKQMQSSPCQKQSALERQLSVNCASTIFDENMVIRTNSTVQKEQIPILNFWKWFLIIDQLFCMEHSNNVEWLSMNLILSIVTVHRDSSIPHLENNVNFSDNGRGIRSAVQKCNEIETNQFAFVHDL